MSCSGNNTRGRVAGEWPAHQEVRRQDADVMQKLSSRVQDFKANKKIGIYKKAQVGNAFKWALNDAGYCEKYIEQLTLWLVSALR
jgi:hypothetical protein